MSPGKVGHDTDIVQQVEEYASRELNYRGAPTIQCRRVIGALKAIGLERRDFSARTVIEHGTYGEAVGNLRNRQAAATVIGNARTLIACGLVVHVFSREPGYESALVHTSPDPRLVVHATVESRPAT